MIRTPTTTIAITILLAFAAAATLTPHALAQDASHPVSGVVVDQDGDPVEGAEVNFWSYAPGGEGRGTTAKTGPDGAFSFDAVEGKAAINAYHPEWGTNAYVELEVPSDKTITLILQRPPPKTATIEGRITDPSGAPVEGADVQAYGYCCAGPGPEPRPIPSPAASSSNDTMVTMEKSSASSPAVMPYPYYPGGGHAVTDADGRYKIATYGGEHTVQAMARGYAQTSTQVTAVDGESVTADIELVKVPARDATLVGRVVDAGTGLPLAGAWVSLSNAEWGRYLSATTDEQGRYTFTTLPGWSQVSIHHYGGPVAADGMASDLRAPAAIGTQYYGHAVSLALKSGETTHDVKLERKPQPTVLLIGYVVDVDAESGVGGAWVNVQNQDTGDWGQAQTDKDGSYKILVRPGHYLVNAYADGYLGGSAMLTVDDPADAKRLDVPVKKGVYRYAPCESADDCGGGGIAYEGRSAVGATAPMGAPEPDMDAKADEAAPPPAPRDAATLSATTNTGAKAFDGGAGELGPYRKADAPAPGVETDAASPSSTPRAGSAPVPFVGAGLLAALAVGVALALRRK